MSPFRPDPEDHKMSNPLTPCGTQQARRRHRRAGETCNTCATALKASTPNLAPCGTHAARRRHKKRGETCEPCAPKQVVLQPCGTRAAYKRHYKNGETPCEPCLEANRQDTAERHRANGTQPITTAADLIEDIIFLLNAGEGEHAILKATGYIGREKSLQARLQRNGRTDLYNRIFNSRELAA